jgi:phage terminase large subunit
MSTLLLLSGVESGGAKTYEVSKFVCFKATVHNKRAVVLRDEKELVRESILNEILLRYDTANASGIMDYLYERLETGIKSRKDDSMLVFTKGFRASSNQKSANLKSISDIDIAVIEEAEDIRDENKFNKFSDSIRKDGSLIIIILNTPDIGHWIVKRFFNTEETEHDGYYKLIPKKLPGFACIQTSYFDNPYLPKHIVTRYEAYGDPEDSSYNKHYYLTDILGYASTGRKGQILRKVRPIKLKDYMALPFQEFYGQDFGTSSPAGLVGVKFDKNNCYCREINYLPANTLTLAKKYCELRLNGGDKIIADNADEKAWRKLKKGYSVDELSADDLLKYPALLSGFNVVPCVKGTDSITYGLDLMDTMNLFAVEESTNLWTEIRAYIYAQDKYGNYTNDPIDDFNHLIDPWRYVVNDQRGKKKFTITTS